MILEKFTKQPADVQDYDISFVDWLNGFGDTGQSITVLVDTGITLVFSVLLSGIAKVWLSGGVSGSNYKITVTLSTTGGRVKQAEIIVKVKEV